MTEVEKTERNKLALVRRLNDPHKVVAELIWADDDRVKDLTNALASQPVMLSMVADVLQDSLEVVLPVLFDNLPVVGGILSSYRTNRKFTQIFRQLGSLANDVACLNAVSMDQLLAVKEYLEKEIAKMGRDFEKRLEEAALAPNYRIQVAEAVRELLPSMKSRVDDEAMLRGYAKLLRDTLVADVGREEELQTIRRCYSRLRLQHVSLLAQMIAAQKRLDEYAVDKGWDRNDPTKWHGRKLNWNTEDGAVQCEVMQGDGGPRARSRSRRSSSTPANSTGRRDCDSWAYWMRNTTIDRRSSEEESHGRYANQGALRTRNRPAH